MGVYGYGPLRGGVFGYGRTYGVYGIADGQGSDADPTVYTGLLGRGDFGSYNVGRVVGSYSEGPAGGFAGYFNGSVYINGAFTVSPQFPKSAAVPHPDGSLRLLYSLECPESWFEDFGRATLSEGRALVELDTDFAAVVRTDDYHVFVTPEGNSNGLYVSDRTDRAFEVREQHDGTSNLAFSYRIAARRRDVDADRLPVFEPPPQRMPVEHEPDELGPPGESMVWEQPRR